MFHMVRKMTNGHFGSFFLMHINVVLLLFCCVLGLGEDDQQMELDSVFERLNCFRADCVMGLAFEISPRVCTNLAGNDLVPLK